VATQTTTTGIDTVPDEAARGGATLEPLELGFVVLHCPEAPGFVGAWLAAGARGDDRLLGRGPARSTDRLPRLTAVYQRPGANHALGPLPCPRVSRAQLEVGTSDDELVLRNVGSASLLVNGATTTEARVTTGDIVEVGSSLMLLCTQRPRVIAPAGAGGLHDFGEPDASGMVGESPAAWSVRRQLRQMARHAGHLLVHGPTGSGKELAVRAFCSLACPDGPLVERNAATLPEGLLDAELFGNLKNYPNAGMAEREGLIGKANGGVLFLDELAELPQSAQTHLLRVLDSGQYQRLGESTARTAKFRLVAATNRPLTSLRDDVLARFTLRLEVPSLASRPDDIPLVLRRLTVAALADDPELCERYLDASGQPRFSRELLRRVIKSPLAANARELQQLALLSIMESKGENLDWIDEEGASDDEDRDEGELDDEATDDEAARIRKALDENHGSLEKTWRALGYSSRFALMRRLKKHRVVVRRKAE
jgi:two-component system, NtrC family, response regulator HydG